MEADTRKCLDDTVKSLLNKSEFAESVSVLRKAIELNSRCAENQFALGYCLLRLNQPGQSLSAYTAAARVGTPSTIDLRNIALDYVLLDDYADARHWIQVALSKDATDAENWYVLGRIQYSTNDASGAAVSFKKALEITPRNAKAENNLGLAFEALNEPEEAIEAYHQAIAAGQESGKPSEQPLMNLAVLLSHKGNLQSALELLLRAVKIAPRDADVQEHLGHVYLDLNILVESRSHLEKAVSLRPSDGGLHFLLGQAYRRSGMKENARSEFTMAASLDATHQTSSRPK